MTPPRVVTRGMAVGARFRGASGTPPPTVCPGMGGSGSLPLIRPCGATFPQGGKARAVVEGFIPPGVSAAAGGRGGVGAPRPTDGDMETLWGLRGHPFPGRRTVGAGHARPGGLRGHPSMVRSVGRGLDPSAGVGGSGSLRGWLPGGWPLAEGFAGRRGRRALRLAREWAAAGACPSSGPAGPPSPKGEGKGCSGGIHPSRGVGGGGSLPPTPAAGPRCGAGGSGCSTSGLTKPALYRRNPGRCRGGSRR